MNEHFTQLSRTMAYALRHNPQSFGLTLDAEGWVPVEDLLIALRQRRSQWSHLQEEDLATVIAQADKKRYEMRDGKIRAYYGHSVASKTVKESVVPPTVLFHGTTRAAAKLIQSEGLKPMGRQFIHLSTDKKTARQVALRHTQQPVILQVLAQQAYQQGYRFYLGNEMVWLADVIPPEFISVAE